MFMALFSFLCNELVMLSLLSQEYDEELMKKVHEEGYFVRVSHVKKFTNEAKSEGKKKGHLQ
jgi:hypothetical protein